MDLRAIEEFDAVYDWPLSRSAKHVRGIAASMAALDTTLAGGYDIVHVHTPIAAFVTRAVGGHLRRRADGYDLAAIDADQLRATSRG